jgi:hypothetical protein
MPLNSTPSLASLRAQLAEAEKRKKVLEATTDAVERSKLTHEHKDALEALKKEVESFKDYAPEEIALIETFLKDTFTLWNKDTAPKAKLHRIMQDPLTPDYKALSADINKEKFGEYTLNPALKGIDLTKAIPKIIELPAEWNGKPLHEVMEHLKTLPTQYPNHILPDITYWKWMIENPDKVPQTKGGVNLKDGNFYFTPGSLVRDGGGHWSVPCVHWGGSEFLRNASRLARGWGSGYHVVLLEIPAR